VIVTNFIHSVARGVIQFSDFALPAFRGKCHQQHGCLVKVIVSTSSCPTCGHSISWHDLYSVATRGL